MKTIPDIFATAPIVYAVNDTYQIMIPVNAECVMWCEIGGKMYCDDSNGLLRSTVSTHRVTVPMEVLNKAKHYTVKFRRVLAHKAYCTLGGDVETYESDFRPVGTGTIRIYHIADAHSRVESPIAACRTFSDRIDLLILNGDIPNSCTRVEEFTAIHRIAAELTDGEIPVVFARGNHDLRGEYAEKLADHTPTDNGKTWFTFRLGEIWGIVLDCGEDKVDAHPEYGNTVVCEYMRRQETEFLRSVIADAEREYLAPGIRYRLVVCHNPFTIILPVPFDIEQETYAEWTKLVGKMDPDLILVGHIHECTVIPVGGERDHHGQPCPVISGSTPLPEKAHRALGLTLTPGRAEAVFTDSYGGKSEVTVLPLKQK